MKIAHILDSFSSGGAEIVALTLARHMLKYHDVEFIIFRPIHHHDSNGFRVHLISLDSLEQFLLSNNYDLLINHFHWSSSHIKVLEVITRLNINFIMVDHSSFNFHLIVNNDTELHNVRFNFYKQANHLVVLNQGTKDDYKNYADIESTVIYNPLVYENIRQYSNLNSCNIIAVGNFDKKIKNIEGLLKTFSIVNLKNPFAVLHVVGKYDKNHIDNLLQKYDINNNNVFLHGVLAHNDLSKIYAVSSVFVMTSIIEGFPMVLVEAAQHKIPIVAMDIRGVTNELFKHNEDAFFVAQGDHNAMAEAILKLLGDIVLRVTMGNSGYNKVQQLSIDKIGSEWIKLIHDTMKSSKNKI